MKELVIRFSSLFFKGDNRSIVVKKNIFGGVILKGISVLCQLLIIPLTIDFISTEEYGLWLTISSLMAWISFFDLGLSNGFRNKFAEAKAKGQKQKAQEYISTTYAVMFIIFSIICVVFFIINPYLQWDYLLNIKCNNDLGIIISATISFFCMQMFLKVITTLLNADQNTWISAIIDVITQITILFIIFILSILTNGSLLKLSLIIGLTPSIILLTITLFLFKTKYKDYRPSFRMIKFKHINDILGLGVSFFIINCSLLFIFQSTNFVLIRVLGSESVTIYTIVYKYFSVVNMFVSIVMIPYWSAYTEAFVKKDFSWMKHNYNKLLKLWRSLIIVLLIMLFISPYVYKFWIGDRIYINYALSIIMAIYILIMTRSSISLNIINGIGKLRIQTVIYVISSIFSIPLMILGCKYFGIEGVVLAGIFTMLLQIFFMNYQIKLLLNNRATGWWNI